MEDVPAHGRGVGTWWSIRSLPTQTILWFYQSCLLWGLSFCVTFAFSDKPRLYCDCKDIDQMPGLCSVVYALEIRVPTAPLYHFCLSTFINEKIYQELSTSTATFLASVRSAWGGINVNIFVWSSKINAHILSCVVKYVFIALLSSWSFLGSFILSNKTKSVLFPYRLSYVKSDLSH